jgi:hypothetical protein
MLRKFSFDFSQDGHFISRFSFDGLNHSRYLKGLTTPRGACFNPQGNIIISDFENHRLILIDSAMTKVSSKQFFVEKQFDYFFINRSSLQRAMKVQLYMNSAVPQESAVMTTEEL